jgi:hypothetical protein
MPLQSFAGSDTADLERAVADVERRGGRVVQVVGNMAGAWWVLVESKPATARKKSEPVRESR